MKLPDADLAVHHNSQCLDPSVIYLSRNYWKVQVKVIFWLIRFWRGSIISLIKQNLILVFIWISVLGSKCHICLETIGEVGRGHILAKLDFVGKWVLFLLWNKNWKYGSSDFLINFMYSGVVPYLQISIGLWNVYGW